MTPTRWAIEGRAVARGAAVGLAVIVPVTIARALVERHVNDLSSSAWIYPLSILVLAAYAAAGVTAARAAHQAPVLQGGVAALAAVVAWLPVRALIWAIRENGRGLVSGDRAALPPADVLGALALGLVVGMLAAALAVRLARPHRSASPATPTRA
ncbi:MAG TPA: hypothetical protein VI462_16755 [Acidimicrobiia bacterium]